MPADYTTQLFIHERDTHDAHVVVVEGILDSKTYLPLRDAIIKACLDATSAVIVDVSALAVPTDSAWAVFTSARWHISLWPDVPLALVCRHRRGRTAVERNGISRYVPVYSSLEEATTALSDWAGLAVRRRARAELPATPESLGRARRLVEEWLTAWSRPDLVSVAKLVVTVFVENVLTHTTSAPAVRLESMDSLVTVAVEDGSTAPAARKEWSEAGGDDVSGLAIVASLCRKWGSSPIPSGKAVWAVIGPENRL